MPAGKVPTLNITALYNNTTAGTDADPAAVDNAVQDIVQTINDNFDKHVLDISGHASNAVLSHPDKSVTRAKLADKVVGAGQLDDAAVGPSHHQDNGIPSRALPDNVILQRHMSDNSVGSAEIQDSAVQARHIPNGLIGSNKLDPALLQNYGDIAVQAELSRINNELMYMTATYEGMGPGTDKTIAQAFPSVTLAQVQNLNASATLSDSADWYVLQKTIIDGKIAKARKIQIRQGTYKLSRALRFGTNDEDLQVVMYGVKLMPATGYTGYLVDGQRYAERIYIKGLYIDGNYKSNGMNLDWVQRFSFQDTYIGRCVIGLRIRACYAGNFVGTTFIQDCLTGLHLDGQNATTEEEVNTINFTNMKIGFNADRNTYKQFFVPKNAGESDTDYNLRVVTYGVKVQSSIALIKFFGITIEGVDYGIKGLKLTNTTAFGTCFFMIEQSYFEYIYEQIIDFYPEAGNAYMKYDVSVLNCRFENSVLGKYNDPNFCEVLFGYGNYTIMGNKRSGDSDYSIRIKQGVTPNTSPAFSLTTDVRTDRILMTDRATAGNQVVTGTHVTKISSKFYENTFNWQQYSPYTGAGLTSVNQYNSAPTLQDENYLAALSPLDPLNLVKYYNMYSQANRDLVFLRPELGVVFQDSINGKFYRMTFANGAPVYTEETNTEKLFERLRSKRIKWLERTTPTTGEKRYCIEFKYDVYEKTGKWYVKPFNDAVEMQLIGTGAEIANIGTAQGLTGFNAKIWNKEIHMAYTWESTYWGMGVATMSDQLRTSKQAIGTTAQRPTGITTGFIYYDTTIVGYVKWDGATWVAYTP